MVADMLRSFDNVDQTKASNEDFITNYDLVLTILYSSSAASNVDDKLQSCKHTLAVLCFAKQFPGCCCVVLDFLVLLWKWSNMILYSTACLDMLFSGAPLELRHCACVNDIKWLDSIFVVNHYHDWYPLQTKYLVFSSEMSSQHCWASNCSGGATKC